MVCVISPASHAKRGQNRKRTQCKSYGGNLVRIRNQEENVYVQHRLNGGKGWIGLNDRTKEGTFEWADDQQINFTYWAANQPNNFNNSTGLCGMMWDAIAATTTLAQRIWTSVAETTTIVTQMLLASTHSDPTGVNALLDILVMVLPAQILTNVLQVINVIAALLVTIQKDLTYASVTAATLEMGAPAENWTSARPTLTTVTPTPYVPTQWAHSPASVTEVRITMATAKRVTLTVD